MSDLPRIAPYAHIYFCEDIVAQESDWLIQVVGQFRSKILVGHGRNWPLPQIVMGVELVIDKRDKLESVYFEFARNDQVLARGGFEEQLAGLASRTDELDPEATRYSMRADLRAFDVDLYPGDKLKGRVVVNGEVLNCITLRVEDPPPVPENGARASKTSRIRRQPAIPSMLLVPGTQLDAGALHAIGVAYAHSGLIVSAHGKRADRQEFFFPALVCSSFAIELLLKFFVVLSTRGGDENMGRYPTGHKLMGLWEQVAPYHKAVVAGLFRNSASEPAMTASEMRIESFEEALEAIGDPFVKWRYAYELNEMSMLSHGAVAEVLDALGHAADFIGKQDRGGIEPIP